MNGRRLNVAGFLILSSCTGQAVDSANNQTRFSITAVGRIDSAEEARHLAASIDGVISEIRVSRGQAVRAGGILANIDCSIRTNAARGALAKADVAAAQLTLVEQGAREEEHDRARAAVAAAEARHLDAKDQLSRSEALVDQGFITTRMIVKLRSLTAETAADFGARKAELAMLTNGARREELAEARSARAAALANAGEALAASRQCELRSPIDGHVLQILRRQGEFSGASQGSPIVIVGDLDRLIVRAEINERDAAAVKVGQKVDIWTD